MPLWAEGRFDCAADLGLSAVRQADDFCIIFRILVPAPWLRPSCRAVRHETRPQQTAGRRVPRVSPPLLFPLALISLML